MIADKNYFGRDFEATLASAGLNLLRPARKGEPDQAGARFWNDPGGHTPTEVWARIAQRVLALTAAIWHNDHAAQPIKRSLLAYDH